VHFVHLYRQIYQLLHGQQLPFIELNILYVNTRDIQRLPTTPFSLMLRKEYFNCPKRDSHAVRYILKRGVRRVCTLVLFSLAHVTVTSCIDAALPIVTKSPKVGPLLIFSIFLVNTIPRIPGGTCRRPCCPVTGSRRWRRRGSESRGPHRTARRGRRCSRRGSGRWRGCLL
jgi:hypothetical protein